MVGEALCLQKPMQPEAFTPRFIATHHGGRVRQTQAAFGLGDFGEHTLVVTCGHGALTRLLTLRPVVKPSFQVFSLSSEATNRTRSGVVSWPLWVAAVVMGFLLHGRRVSCWTVSGKEAYQQRPVYGINQQA